jgi:hypothetical protein
MLTCLVMRCPCAVIRAASARAISPVTVVAVIRPSPPSALAWTMWRPGQPLAGDLTFGNTTGG